MEEKRAERRGAKRSEEESDEESDEGLKGQRKRWRSSLVAD